MKPAIACSFLLVGMHACARAAFPSPGPRTEISSRGLVAGGDRGGPRCRAREGRRALASRSFRQGEAHFGRREFREAAIAFERAARLAPHPSPWLNAAEAWARAGDLVRARAACEKVLSIRAAPAFEEVARRRLEHIESRRPAMAHAAGGRTRSLEASAEPRAATSTASDTSPSIARAHDAHDLTIDPPPPPEATLLPEPVFFDAGPPIGTWIAFGLAATSATIGGVMGALTLRAKEDFDQGPTTDRADTFFDRRTATNLALATALASATTGLMIWALDEPDGGGELGGSVSLRPTRDGVLLAGAIRY